MKREIFLTLFIAGLLSSCGECNHVDEDKNHFCDICEIRLSDHVDEDKDHHCDYCETYLSGHKDLDGDFICDYCGKEIEPPTPFAVWPDKEIQDLIKSVCDSETVIPRYNKADDIEINQDDLAESGYFSIYCYTENNYSANEYKAILKAAGWNVEEEKDENEHFNAKDENLEVSVNFFYNKEFFDLEIRVSKYVK